jgi:dolichol-phosphate mannosyltransferase
MTHRLWRQGFRILEVPIIFTERFHGRSKMSGHIIREAFIMVLRLWFQNNLRRRPLVPPAQSPSVGPGSSPSSAGLAAKHDGSQPPIPHE